MEDLIKIPFDAVLLFVFGLPFIPAGLLKFLYVIIQCCIVVDKGSAECPHFTLSCWFCAFSILFVD